jgi:rhamnosyltransferase
VLHPGGKFLKNRAAIYVFYDKDGIVDSYVTYMLRSLLTVCQRIVVVCNGTLSDAGRLTLSEITDDIFVRQNEGFDVWGYKAGIEYIGWENLSQYDELVLMNDSVFGPLYPLDAIFDEMGRKGLDFWGITKHGEFKNPDGLTKRGVFPEHIQSYFYAFNRNMFLSAEFKKYWSNLRVFKSWNETVSFFESQFTKHFADLGFTWGVYADTDKDYSDFYDVSLILQMAFEMVSDYRCPFIKRKSFTIEYENFQAFSLGNSSRKAFDYICENTDYDVDMIWEHILRTGSFRNIKDNLHLNYVLPSQHIKDKTIDVSDAKVALLAHITYEDQIDVCMSYMKSTERIADVYVTTITKALESSLIDRLGLADFKSFKVILLPESSKGRDVGALWVALKQYMDGYDYICFLHNKKSPQMRPLTIGRGFAERCMLNTLGSREYVLNVLGMFEENPRLGMLFPPPVIHGPYKRLVSGLWAGNYNNTVALAKRLGVDVILDKYIDPIFPAGGMFWFKPEALRKIMKHDWEYEDFPDEPMPGDGTIGHAFERIYCLAAQSEGYYSAWVMIDYFMPVEITSISYILSTKFSSVSDAIRNSLFINLRGYPKLYNFLRSIYRFFKRVLRGHTSR